MLFYLTIISSIIIDITTKYISTIYFSQKINVIGNIIYLKLTKNPGIAFGFNVPFLKILTLVLIIGIFYYYHKEEKQRKIKLLDISFGLILGGAIGNGIERIFFGNVTDFIGIQYFSVFNFADAFICIGALLYLYNLFFITKE